MVAKYSEKIANQRKDYLHKITRELVENNDRDINASKNILNNGLEQALVK